MRNLLQLLKLYFRKKPFIHHRGHLIILREGADVGIKLTDTGVILECKGPGGGGGSGRKK